jgi:Domain of unknown function(DUF2779)
LPRLWGALGYRGSILTYTNYEEGVIKELAKDFQQYPDQLVATLGRVKDFMPLSVKITITPHSAVRFHLKTWSLPSYLT